MVEVTEMDMSVYSWMEQKKEITQELLELQAELYGEILRCSRDKLRKAISISSFSGELVITTAG